MGRCTKNGPYPTRWKNFCSRRKSFALYITSYYFPLSLSIQMKPSQKTNCLPDDYIITRAIIYVIYNFIYTCFPLQQQHVIHSFSTNYRMCKPYQTCKPFLCESTSFSFWPLYQEISSSRLDCCICILYSSNFLHDGDLCETPRGARRCVANYVYRNVTLIINYERIPSSIILICSVEVGKSVPFRRWWIISYEARGLSVSATFSS